MSEHSGLEAIGVCYAYGDVRALHEVDLRIRPGRRLALLGANGSGKTTLLHCLAGALQPTVGRVQLDGRALDRNRKALDRHRRIVQLVVQDPDDQLFSADVFRDVSFGPLNLGMTAEQARQRVEETLKLLDVADLAERPTHQLSFGQRKRVAIAGAVAMAPRYLLLDEPTAGLDPAGQDELVAALQRLERGGTTVALATHDVDFALSWADDAAVVTGGRVRSGPAVEVLSHVPEGSRLRAPWIVELTDRLGLDTSTHRTPRTLDDMVEVLGRTLADARVGGGRTERGGTRTPEA